VGRVGSVALTEAFGGAVCGCDLAEQAATMADARGAKVLAADAVACQSAWRCPRVGGAIDPDALDEEHRAALDRVRALTGCDDNDLRTCPGHYTRTPEAHEVVRMHRWLKAGALHLRVPYPTGAMVDALDLFAESLAAREADELERMKRNTGGTRGE
jgi:hypothetical protein